MKKIKNIKLKITLTAVFAAVVLLFNRFSIGCLVVRFFGITCPTCGLTRAILSAIQLDFASAFRYNFMFWAVPIMFLYLFFEDIIFSNPKVNKVLFTAIGLGFFVNWIFRLIFPL